MADTRRLHLLNCHLRVRQSDRGPRAVEAGRCVASTEPLQSPLRVGVAGCHRQTTRALGSHNFSSALALNPEVDIVAAFDHGAQTRAAYVECWQNSHSSKLESHETVGGMLASARPDIVVISSRQTFHAEMIEAAVAAGARGILVDKPLCTSLEECDRIVRACEGTDVPLLYALDRRFSSRWAAVRAAVVAGVVGTVRSVAVSGVSNTVNHGCHYADLAMSLMGDPEPVWVSAQLVQDPVREWVPPPPADTGSLDPASNCTVGFSNGAVAVLSPAGSLGVDVVGDKGRLVVWGDASAATLWAANSREKEDLCLPTEDTSTWPAGQRMVADLVQAVRSRRRKTACDTDCARRATEIAFGAHWSSDKGGARVELPLAVRTMRVESLPWGNENGHHPDVAESSNANNPWAQ